MNSKKTAVYGIYASALHAEQAVDHLVQAGFPSDDISVLLPDEQSSKAFAFEMDTKAPEGTTAGVTAGGAIGGALGVLAGIGVLVIPGVGPFIAAGPIMAGLAGLGVGGAVGGLIGALVGMGMPEYEAKRYPRKDKERIPPTLTPEEVRQIFVAVQTSQNIFKRGGSEVAKQVYAFTLIERYTGLAVGDVSKLRMDEVNRDRNELFLHRKKTGEPVWTVVPQFVIDALYSFKPDSQAHFFWSGEGKIHTRTSKWGERLQKLYVYAGVRVTEEHKVRRSGGKLKEAAEKVLVSAVTPHWWRHTFVRDLYLENVPVETIADLLGDDVETVRKYYSSFDELRKQKLKSEIEAVWAHDTLTQALRSQSPHA